jgi:MoxR-like ATPase
MPVSMGLDDKENLLIKAFNEGAVVMIDEINSSPMMERLLNDLLMGKNPRDTTRAPEKPGFMIIGTQNPISMAGRRAASTALKRRLITTELPEYNTTEISEILLQKGVPEEDARLMIDVYESKRGEAIAGNLNLIPNFRHLMTLADNHIRALEAKKVSEIPLDAANKMKAFFEEIRGETRKDLDSGAAAKPGP